MEGKGIRADAQTKVTGHLILSILSTMGILAYAPGAIK